MSSVKPGIRATNDNRPAATAQTPRDSQTLRPDKEPREAAIGPLWRRPDTMKGATFLAWQWPAPGFAT